MPAGLAPYTDHNGNVWAADEDFSGGAATDAQYTVPGTSDGIVFYDRRTGASFSYNLPVANGTYTVQLFFTDPIVQRISRPARVFNVTAQGQTVLPNFDIIAAGGGKAPIAERFNVNVTNGMITLDLTGVGTDSATLAVILVTKCKRLAASRRD